MANSGDHFRADLPGHDEIDLLFGTANPRSDRTNCLSRDELAALVRRTGGLDDPGYVHLTECSACYNEFRALQQAIHEQVRKTRATRLWIAAAAVALIGAAGTWWYVHTLRVPAHAPPAAGIPATIDLRPYAVTRSATRQNNVPALALTPASLSLTILLPVGSAPGSYDVRLLDAASLVLASASGPAEIRDFVTTLQVHLDLSAVPHGDHHLAVRRAGEEWSVYPVALR